MDASGFFIKLSEDNWRKKCSTLKRIENLKLSVRKYIIYAGFWAIWDFVPPTNTDCGANHQNSAGKFWKRNLSRNQFTLTVNLLGQER